MKKIISIAFLLIFAISAEAQDVNDGGFCLQTAYNRVINDNSTEHWRDFFNLFPDTFESFDSIFGYHHDKKGPLYDMYQQYIYLFFEAQHHVKGTVYYDKLIKIAKDGRWDADAISLFQSCIVSLIISDSSNYQEQSVFLETLSSFSETDISNFWRFYFDDLYPDCYGEKYKKTIAVLLGYKRLLPIMEKTYKNNCNK